ncbi:MAG TPA: VWA domain-containing protein [Myxococcaceae bacterium]|nr:VWA domain-containing protein [Myxococcaceae bacterium]
MEARIVEFAEVLRQNGVRVSTSEVMDGARAAAMVDLSERENLRSVLRTTLVKRSADVDVFDRAFALFFSGAARTVEALETSLLAALEEQGLLSGDERAMVVASLRALGGQLSPLTEAALQGDQARLARLLRGATLQLDLSQLQSPLQSGFFARRLLAAAGGDRLQGDVEALEAELARRGISAEGLELVSQRLAAALRSVEESARREVERQGRVRIRRNDGPLAERTLQTLSRAELAQAEAAVRRLGERLKARLIRRERTRRKGALNVRRTLRRNMPWGGVPMVPRFRSRRPERPEVVVLCDVSDSVRNVSRLMLLFMHTLQSLFSRVRSFVFVSELGEVTEHFRRLEPEEAIDLAVAGQAVSLQSNSNYGLAFTRFVQRELPSIRRRTTVIVIGDGRNNYNAPAAWALRDIRRKARRLLWICPEEERAWGFGDSEMRTYAPICHQVTVVRTLEDLTRAADALVPR